MMDEVLGGGLRHVTCATLVPVGAHGPSRCEDGRAEMSVDCFLRKQGACGTDFQDGSRWARRRLEYLCGAERLLLTYWGFTFVFVR